MDKENTIFFHLRNHRIDPPPELLDAILEKINKDGKRDLKTLFEGLAEYEITPPSLIHPGILIKQRPARVASTSFSQGIYRYRAAAAILLLIAASLFIYAFLHRNREKDIAVVPKHAKEVPTAPRPPDTSGVAPAHLAARYSAKKGTLKSDDHFYSSRINIGNTNFLLINDDVLATFASFSYKQVPDFLKDTETENVLIKTDMYTSINISRPMRSMMKKMYQVRRNGKPTHLARKTKRKLLNWQKADVRYFDKKMNKNPLDIFDLSDFIFDR